MNLTYFYRQNLETDIITLLAQRKNIPVRMAIDIYYKSKLARQIEQGLHGIDNMSPIYLAEDLIENEPELFDGN